MAFIRFILFGVASTEFVCHYSVADLLCIVMIYYNCSYGPFVCSTTSWIHVLLLIVHILSSFFYSLSYWFLMFLLNLATFYLKSFFLIVNIIFLLVFFLLLVSYINPILSILNIKIFFSPYFIIALATFLSFLLLFLPLVLLSKYHNNN